MPLDLIYPVGSSVIRQAWWCLCFLATAAAGMYVQSLGEDVSPQEKAVWWVAAIIVFVVLYQAGYRIGSGLSAKVATRLAFHAPLTLRRGPSGETSEDTVTPRELRVTVSEGLLHAAPTSDGGAYVWSDELFVTNRERTTIGLRYGMVFVDTSEEVVFLPCV